MEANAASLALITDGRVLMIQRAREPYEGLWTLPGGRMEPGERPEACARREITEEMGLVADDLKPVTHVSTGGGAFGYRIAVFASRIFSGTPAPSDEVANWFWCAQEDLTGISTTPDMDCVFLRLQELIDISRPH